MFTVYSKGHVTCYITVFRPNTVLMGYRRCNVQNPSSRLSARFRLGSGLGRWVLLARARGTQQSIDVRNVRRRLIVRPETAIHGTVGLQKPVGVRDLSSSLSPRNLRSAQLSALQVFTPSYPPYSPRLKVPFDIAGSRGVGDFQEVEDGVGFRSVDFDLLHHNPLEGLLFGQVAGLLGIRVLLLQELPRGESDDRNLIAVLVEELFESRKVALAHARAG